MTGRVREVMDAAVTEKAFMAEVVALAKALGWLCYHTWRSDRSEAGYPDLCLVRHHRIVFAELKAEKGRVSQAQAKWLDALLFTGRVEVHMWRPSDWPAIEEALR